MWHVSSGVAVWQPRERVAIHLLLTYLLIGNLMPKIDSAAVRHTREVTERVGRHIFLPF